MIFSDNRYSVHNLAATALSFFPFLFFSFYSLARIGFNNDFLLYSKIIGVSLLLLNIDCFWNKGWGVVTKSNFYVVGFLIIVALFFFFEIPALVGYILATLGYIIFAQNFITNIPIFKKKKNWLFIAITCLAIALFTLYVFSVFYTNFLNPFSIDRISSRGLHIDTLFHASIAQMLKTYHIPTTGVDGLNIIKYHFGSHAIAASLSKLLDINVLLYYQMVFPSIIFPLLFKAFLYFVFDLSTLSSGEKKNNYLVFLLLFLAGFIGFLNYDGISKITLKALVGWQTIYAFENYTLSMLFLFALFSTVVQFKDKFHEKISLTHFIFVLLFLILFIAAGLAKISTGFLIFCLGQYFCLRVGAYKRIFWIISDLIFIAIAWLIYSAVNDPNDAEGGWYYFQLIKDVNQAPVIWFILLHFFWTIAIFSYYLLYLRIKNIKEILHAFKAKQFLLAEVVLVMSICGLIPGNIMWFYNRNAVYFTEPQNWVALGIIIYLAYYRPIDYESISTYVTRYIVPVIIILSIPYYDHIFTDWLDTSILFSFVPVIAALVLPSFMRMESTALKYFLLAVIFFPLLKEMEHNTRNFASRVRHLTNTIRAELVPNVKTALEYNPNKWPDVSAIGEKWRIISEDSLHVFYRQLFALDKWRIEEKRKAIVYVASRNAYKSIYMCQALPFIMPAITGMVQYRGLEPSDRCNNFSFGLESFQGYPSVEMAKVNIESVKEDVTGRGYEKLIAINVDKKTVDVIPLDNKSIKKNKERIESESCASRVFSIEDTPQYIMLGPLANLPAGSCKFRFYVKTDNIISTDIVATIDLFVNNGSLITRDLRGVDFTKSNEYQYFDIEYKNDLKLSNIDFRVYHHGKGNIGVHHVQIESIEKTTNQWSSINLPSAAGEIIFDNILNLQVRHANQTIKAGYITFGPYITLQAGGYNLEFWLKVRGDKGEKVVDIDAVANSSTLLLSRLEIEVNEMNATAQYVKYEIPFDLCKKGESIEFRVYHRGKGEIWLDKISLTQKKIFAR
jgi:hypothetical protein